MGKPEIEAFLLHLVMKRNVASSTQNQAFNGDKLILGDTEFVQAVLVQANKHF